MLASFQKGGNAVIHHHFNDHEYCTGDWCQHKTKSAEELVGLGKYRSKVEHADLWGQCQNALARFLADEKIADMFHDLPSQKNESFNRVIMRFAPKEICHGKSMSLTYRINVAIGINSIGHVE